MPRLASPRRDDSKYAIKKKINGNLFQRIKINGPTFVFRRVGRLQTDDVDRLRRLHSITFNYITLHYIFGGSERSQFQSHYNVKTQHIQNDACINGNPLKFCHILVKYALQL